MTRKRLKHINQRFTIKCVLRFEKLHPEINHVCIGLALDINDVNSKKLFYADDETFVQDILGVYNSSKYVPKVGYWYDREDKETKNETNDSCSSADSNHPDSYNPD